MNKNKLIKALIYIVCFAFAGLLFYKTFVPLAPHLWEALKTGDESQIEAFLKESGELKGLIYLFLLQGVQVISIVLHGAPIEIAGGMAYGFLKSFVTCHLSFVLTNILIFAFGRRVRSDFIDGDKTAKIFEFLSKGDPFVMLILCFMVPVMPNGIIPYAASATKISTVKYAFSVFLGSSVQIFMMCAIGRKILVHDYLFMVIIIVLDFIAMFFLYKYKENVNSFVTTYGRKLKRKIIKK